MSDSSIIQGEVCLNEEESETNMLEKEDAIETIASNPIHLYKLVKGMHTFARDVYPLFLYSYLNTGIPYIFLYLNHFKSLTSH